MDCPFAGHHTYCASTVIDRYPPNPQKESDLCGCGQQHYYDQTCTGILSAEYPTYCEECVKTCAIVNCHKCGKKNSPTDLDALQYGTCFECFELELQNLPPISGNCDVCGTLYVQDPARAAGIEMCPICVHINHAESNCEKCFKLVKLDTSIIDAEFKHFFCCRSPVVCPGIYYDCKQTCYKISPLDTYLVLSVESDRSVKCNRHQQGEWGMPSTDVCSHCAEFKQMFPKLFDSNGLVTKSVYRY